MGNKSLTVAKYEFLKTVKRKGFLFTAFILPLLLTIPILVGMHYLPSISSGSSADEKIGFVDHAGFLEPDANFTEYGDIETAKHALMEGDISCFFVVQKHFFNDTEKIPLYSKEAGSFFSSSQKRMKDFVLRNLLRQAKISDELAEKIRDPIKTEEIKLDKQSNIVPEKATIGNVLLPYALAILLVLTIMTSSGYLMQGIAEEKESRTGELLLSSISADQLLEGKILGYGSVGLIQISIWILVGLVMVSNTALAGLFANIELSLVFGLALVYFILGYSLFATSIACAAAISPSAREAQQVSMIFTIFALFPMMFAQFIIRNPNSTLPTLLTYFPYSAPFVTMMRLSMVEVPFYQIILSITILLISIIMVKRLSGRIFRMGMLMYGKRASLKEIVGFLKEK